MVTRVCVWLLVFLLLASMPVLAQLPYVAQDELAAPGVAFSADGSMLSAVLGAEVKTWRLGSGEPVAALTGMVQAPLTVEFSPSGALFAVGCMDGTISLYDLAGNLERTISAHGDFVRDLAFSPAGSILASASDDGSVRLWDVASGEQIEALEDHPAYVRCVAFGPDGELVASGCDDGVVRLWDAGNGSLLRELKGHGDFVRSVAISPDGAVVASGADDMEVRLWNSRTGEEIAVLRGHSDWVRGVAFSPDGTRLASAADDGMIRLWDLQSRDIARTLQEDTWFLAVTYSPDGRFIATGDTGGAIRLWDANSGEALASASSSTILLLAIALSADGTTLAAGSAAGDVWVWDLAAAEAPAREMKARGVSAVFALTFSADAGLLVAGGDGAELALIDLASGETTRTIDFPEVAVALHVVPGGRLWAAGVGGMISSWSLADGVLLHRVGGPGHAVTVVGTSRGEVRSGAVTGTGVQSALFAEDAETVMLGVADQGALCIALSRDGSLLATGSRWGTVQIGDPDGSSGMVLAGEAHSDYVRGVAFSPDGSLLASASDDGMVKIWSVERRALVHTLAGHSDWVRAVRFIDDERVASCADDGTVRIWNALSGEELRVMGAADQKPGWLVYR